MKSKVEEISINGINYVPKDSIKKQEINTENYCIVRTYSAGVFAGNIIREEGQEVEMENVRRIWYWDGAASLSQLAVDGTSQPDNCKFPCEVPKIKLKQAIEIIPCTKKSMLSIKGVPEWKK